MEKHHHRRRRSSVLVRCRYVDVVDPFFVVDRNLEVPHQPDLIGTRCLVRLRVRATCDNESENGDDAQKNDEQAPASGIEKQQVWQRRTLGYNDGHYS